MATFSITDLRLQNQHLVNAEFTSPAYLVKRMAAVQLQDHIVGKWAWSSR